MVSLIREQELSEKVIKMGKNELGVPAREKELFWREVQTVTQKKNIGGGLEDSGCIPT